MSNKYLGADIHAATSTFCVRKLSDETIFLAEKGDKIHSMDEMATDIWETVDGQKNLGDILDIICQQYDVKRSIAEADLMVFMDTIAAKELISFKEQT